MDTWQYDENVEEHIPILSAVLHNQGPSVGRGFGCILAILFFVATVIYTLMVVLGSQYVSDCPGQKNIPVYLIVGGLVGLLLCITGQVLLCGGKSRVLLITCTSLFGLFTICWYGIGCYWVYPSLIPVIRQNGTDYCNSTLYSLSFTIVTLPIFLVGCGCCCACCVCSSGIHKAVKYGGGGGGW